MQLYGFLINLNRLENVFNGKVLGLSILFGRGLQFIHWQ